MPSPRILAQKQQVVADLVNELKDAKSVVISNYQGLDVAQDTEMRRAFREAGLTYRVVKNTIAIRALEQLGITGLEQVLTGPTALAFSTEDVVLAPSLIKKFADQFKKTEIKGGVVEGQVSELKSILELASVPPINVLQGQLAFTLLFPITRLAMTLNAMAKKAEEAGAESVAQIHSGVVVAEPAESEEPAPAAAPVEAAEEAPTPVEA